MYKKLFTWGLISFLVVMASGCENDVLNLNPNVSDSTPDFTDASIPDETSPCDAISLADLQAPETLLYTTNAISPLLGTSLADLFWIEVYDDNVGEIKLGEGVESNYNSCNHCVLITEDSPKGDLIEASRLFFATGGSLFFFEDSTPTEQFLKVEFANVILTEVTVDKENTGFLTTPVANGSCLKVDNITLTSVVPPNATEAP